MKKLLMLLSLLLVLMASPFARADEPSRHTRDELVDGLLQLGGRALNGYLEGELEEKEARRASAQAKGEPQSGWVGLRDDMLSTFIQKSAEEIGEEPLGRWLAHALKQALDVLLEDYKEQYKSEGRAYARELGDMMLERVSEDPKISASLISLQVLCWSVIAYLTLVTLVVVFCLLWLRRAYARLLREVEALRRRAEGE